MTNNHSELDQLLRQKLAELPLATATPADWDLLSVSLDSDVDFGLRTALSGLAAEESASGWEVLERKLGPQTAADAGLAAALNGITPEPTPGSWNALATKMDDSLGREVDVIVASHLAREAGRLSGWPALAARLELISHRRQLVGAWKVTEVCVLLSLLLLLLRFGPGEGRDNDVIAALAEGFPIEANTERETQEAQATETVADELFIPIEKQDSRNAEAVLPVEATLVVVRRAKAADLPTRPNVIVARIATPRQLAESMNTEEIDDFVLSTDPLDGPSYKAEWGVTLPSPALTLPAIDHSVPVRYYLSPFISPGEINQVITKESAVGSSNLSARKELTYSASAGVLLDISKGRDGLQIGAIYSRHAYTPAELTRENCFAEGNCPEGYNQFVYHSMSFPFSYERSLFANDKWRFATRAGMALSIITQSDFSLMARDGQDNLEAALRAPPARPIAGGTGRSRPDIEIDVDDVLAPPPGWFEGGSILSNASFYLESGFTVERTVNPRWSLYLSPSYGRVINLREEGGVGPYNDKIHRASLRFGSRFLLSRK